MRYFQRWLHQHIFKVGWLITKNFQTTTILYYTFFLPGVVLYEIVYWLMAGFLDVRADRAITWPEKQEIAELRLNFVKLSKKASRIKVAIISATPLVLGIVAIWLISNGIFNLPSVLERMSSGRITDVVAAIGQLVATPDVWLWIYFAFAISNTMIPTSFKDFSGFWVVVGVFAVVMVILLFLGIGDEIFESGIATPLSQALSILSGTFGIIIALNLFITAVLSIVENTIEWITGDSATFKDGKLIAIRRSELHAQRVQEAQRARQRAQRSSSAPALPGGPPSVYKLSLPIPGPPGKEPITQAASAIVAPERPATPMMPQRPSPSVISGTSSTSPAPASSPSLTSPTPSPALSPSPAASMPSMRPASPLLPLRKPDVDNEEDEVVDDEVEIEDADDGYEDETDDYRDEDDESL